MVVSIYNILLFYARNLFNIFIFFFFFTERNSKILDREFGYWAEQIPVIEAPLCAVTDPMRDFRWHSFRCGGPEIASFLCEMEGSVKIYLVVIL